jgi:hypothetical protein
VQENHPGLLTDHVVVNRDHLDPRGAERLEDSLQLCRARS